MLYQIKLTKDVKKFLVKHENIARIFYDKLKILSQNTFSNALDINPLK